MKKTRSHDSRGNLEHDWISSMPDELLTHILSFLSTKEAVQTCVLSKRWKNTWVAVPSLNINDNDFLIDDWSSKDDCSGDSDEERTIAVARSEQLRMSVGRVERFMTGFLDNRAPTNLDRVCCMRQFYSFQPDASFGWLDRVLLLMPLHIHIFITSWAGNLLDVPDLVFSCASLQHLSLSLYAKVKAIIRPVSINLPSLKFLELTKVELQHDFTQKLFIGCPSLERLILCCCEVNFSSISSEVLKELTLNDCLLYEQMQISCPNLVSLFMGIDLARGGISLKNMSSLVNARIRLYQFPVDYVPVLSLFCGLSNVTNLKLHLHLLPNLKEQLEKEIPNCRNFNNLKKLVVSGKWDMSYDFYLIACLLKRSPNLKKLGLFLFDESQGQIQEPKQEVSGEGLFQHEYLEKVKISTMYGYKLSSELNNAMIKTLGLYVKKIGNLIMT